MRRTLALAALAALLVTTGCTGGPPPAAGTSQDAGSPTPQATATPTPTSGGDGYPPGVSADGIENLTALLDAHEAALEGTGYVLESRSNLTATLENGTIRTITNLAWSTVRVEGDGDRAYERHVVNHSLRGDRVTELWTNGSVTLVRTWRNESFRPEPTVGYSSAPSRENAFVGSPGWQSAALILRLSRFEVVDHGDGRTTLAATGANETAVAEAFGENATVLSLSATLVVDDSGRIRSFEGRLVVEPGENASLPFERVWLTGNIDLRTDGAVGVAKPQWVPAAYDAATVVDVAVEVVDGKYVKLTNRGPDTIPANATVGFLENGSATVRPLGEPVEPGETVWVYLPAGGHVPAVAREKPDAAAQDLSGDDSIIVSSGGSRLVQQSLADE